MELDGVMPAAGEMAMSRQAQAVTAAEHNPHIPLACPSKGGTVPQLGPFFSHCAEKDGAFSSFV